MTMFRNIFLGICTLLFFVIIFAKNPIWIAHDYENGVIVEIREKYGPTITDTCNVVCIIDDCFYLSTKDGVKRILPKSNYSITIKK